MQDRGRAVEWDLQGRPVLVIGVTLDIDAAKHAEAHLRSSESMLETAAWGAGIGLWETNFTTDTTRWFNDWCVRHDIDPCDGTEHVNRWDENLHPDEGPEATRKFNEHIAGKAEYYDAEYRIKTRGGAWRWVFERGRVVERDAQGKALRMLGVCMDLDETKVAERRANARNERVEAALQLTTAGVWDWDVEHNLTNHTDGYYRVFGVDPAFGRANIKTWRTVLGTDPDREIERFRERLLHVDAAAQVLETEYRFRHTDGSWHWALDRAYVVDRAPDGSTRRVLGLVVDITARKIRETGLSAADQRFRAIARELRCVIYEIDAETGLSSGEGVDRVLGYSNTDLPRPTDWAALVHPDDQPLLQQWFDRSAESMVALQYRIRHHDGHYVTLLDSPCVVRDAAGKVVRIVGVAMDISEQATAQEALRASQELLQIVAAGTGDWLILVDTDRRVQFINRGIRARSRESILGQRIDEIAIPEDRPSILAALTQVLQTGEPVDLQLASSGNDGRLFDSRIRAVSAPAGITGAVINITEITDRQAAQRLRETQARMFELLHEGVVVIDINNMIRMANPAFERMFGFQAGTAVAHLDRRSHRAAAGHAPRPARSALVRVDHRSPGTLAGGIQMPPARRVHVRGGLRRDAHPRRRRDAPPRGHHRRHRAPRPRARDPRNRGTRTIAHRLGPARRPRPGSHRCCVNVAKRGRATPQGEFVSAFRRRGHHQSRQRCHREHPRDGTWPRAGGRGPRRSHRRAAVDGGARAWNATASGPTSTTSLKEPLTLDDGAATHLYRIAQEAFTNAIRHGRVTQVTIDLATAEGTLTLSVQDNGRGFDERNASNNGMGMKLMRYRAQMLGGDVTIANNAGGGVVVRCTCPHRAPPGGDSLPRGGFPLKD